MTVRPDFGPEYGEDEWRTKEVVPPDEDADKVGEREVEELEREDTEVDYLDPESNEAHAPGQVCARCGRNITATQDARMRADGQWVHEVCPPGLTGGEPPASAADPEH
ncbi:MAG TPA: hypothetical protein VG253_11925 [Streptosporangiaceae bacterium]|jgi:hypothetical protein|nr:hypothetical protein [Streptosporangiaceae bacterium]